MTTDKAMSELLDEGLRKDLAKWDQLSPAEKEIIRKRVLDINKSSMKGTRSASDGLMQAAADRLKFVQPPDTKMTSLDDEQGSNAQSA